MVGPEMDPRQKEPNQERIDRLLRRSFAAPIPSLPVDFDQRVMGALRRRSRPLDRYHWILVTGYGLLSVVVSAVVMRGQGLDWGVVSGTIFAPLLLIAVAGSAQRAARTNRVP